MNRRRVSLGVRLTRPAAAVGTGGALGTGTCVSAWSGDANHASTSSDAAAATNLVRGSAGGARRA